jgi:hypothetical protein
MNVHYSNELRHLISSNNVLIYLVPKATDTEFSLVMSAIILHEMQEPWDNHSFSSQWAQWHSKDKGTLLLFDCPFILLLNTSFKFYVRTFFNLVVNLETMNMSY